MLARSRAADPDGLQEESPAVRVLAFMEASTITGPAKNLFGFAVRARQAGTEVRIVAFERGLHSSPCTFSKGAAEAGLAVDVIRERHAFDPRVLGQIKALVRDRRPDILQTHNLKSHFLIRFAGLHRPYRWIAFHHGYTTTDLKMRLYNQLNRWSLPSADRVVTVCGAFAADLRRTGVPADRIAVRHNTIQPFTPPAAEDVLALRQRLGIPDAALVVFCAGRFSQEKAHADLIRAAASLSGLPDTPPFRLLLAGNGPERQALECLAAELGIREQVILCGHQDYLAPFYAVADVFALPSHSEGSPNVLLEAMAAGCAVAATSVGGVPEIAVNGETALLVPKGDPGALSHAIGRLLADEALRRRLGAQARAEVVRFAPEAYCEAMLDLYRDVLAGTGATRICGN
ncbi:MAG TPA: glycosyltransferase [Bryobacteraceae bacterium]|nr:glycosyltransferase [Bryobacteraceae bacterium]